MSIFSRFFEKKTAEKGPAEQAVIVYLDGVNLPERVYAECDLSTIGDMLGEVIARGNLGEYDGNETGATETTLYMYGLDAEKLFLGVEQTLRSYPLCQGARVVIRYGGPGAKQREIRL